MASIVLLLDRAAWKSDDSCLLSRSTLGPGRAGWLNGVNVTHVDTMAVKLQAACIPPSYQPPTTPREGRRQDLRVKTVHLGGGVLLETAARAPVLASRITGPVTGAGCCSGTQQDGGRLVAAALVNK